MDNMQILVSIGAGLFAIIGFIWGTILHNGLNYLSRDFANYKTHVAETYPNKEYMATLKKDIGDMNHKLDEILKTGILNRRS